jgi:hypothetical protein
MSKSKIPSDLHSVVEHAYTVFGSYRPGPQLMVCRCGRCVGESVEKRLLNTPLRQIPQHVLSEYTWAADADDPSASANELRYFLPRYFELIAVGEHPCFGDPEPTLRRLGNIGFRAKWPAVEVAAIDKFFSAYLAHHLTQSIGWTKSQNGEPYAFSDVANHLCVTSYGGCDIRALLAEWDNYEDSNADAHLAVTVDSWLDVNATGALEISPGAFWRDRADAAILADWLARGATADRLSRANAQATTTDLRSIFANAERILRSIV